MWPQCDEATLLRELAAVVRSGWDLPNRPERERAVSHLLLLAEGRDGYVERAQYLLRTIDEVLVAATDGVTGDDVDEMTGLRILFGTLPEYKLRSVTIRREAASEYLVPKWRTTPPKDRQRAATFAKRHQGKALARVLDLLRAELGSGVGSADASSVEAERTYEVDYRRQIVRVAETGIFVATKDDLEGYSWYEPRHADLGTTATEFKVLDHPLGPTCQLHSIEDVPFLPNHRQMAVEFDRSLSAGERFALAWEEHISFDGPQTENWIESWVSVGTPTDASRLTMSVRFLADRPAKVWWFTTMPQVEPGGVTFKSDQELQPDETGAVTYVFRNDPAHTTRGIKWLWE